MIATARRTAPLVARPEPDAGRPPAPTPAVPPAAAPVPARVRPRVQRSAASVGWWGLSLLVASLGVVVLVGFVTYERVGRRDTAVHVLTVALQQPTERLIVRELARPAGGSRLAASADLVAFDVDRAAAAADPATVARAAAEKRAVQLYDEGLPPDPGPTRTEIGVSRDLVGVMSEQNHDKVADTRTAAAIFALALLAWCFVQARDDNMLLLPACALTGGWLVASAAKLLVGQMLTGVNGASATYVGALESAAMQPLGLVKTAAAGLLVGAVIFRFVTLGRQGIARRRHASIASAV